MKILEGIEKFHYLNTNQIAELFFSKTIVKPIDRIKKTNERMKKLYDRGYVQRFRFPQEPYIFTIKGGKFSNRILHYLMITQCWIILNQDKIKPSGSVLNCEIEVKQEGIITDLLIEEINNFRPEGQKKRVYWIEIENESNGDIFEKIEGYESLTWSKRSENQSVGQLIVVCKKSGLLRKLQDSSFDIPVKAYYYNNLETEWKW
jgi:hypothetical protein